MRARLESFRLGGEAVESGGERGELDAPVRRTRKTRVVAAAVGQRDEYAWQRAARVGRDNVDLQGTGTFLGAGIARLPDQRDDGHQRHNGQYVSTWHETTPLFH